MNALKHMFRSVPIATVNGNKLKNWRDMAALWFLTTLDLARMAQGGVDKDAFLDILNREIDFVQLAKELKTLLIEWREINSRSWGTILFWVMCHRTEVLQPVLPAIEHYAMNRDAQSFQIVHHYLAFLYKAPTDNPKLEDQAISDYLDVEQSMPETFPEDELRMLREVLAEWCSTTEAVGLPDFGPGSTADAGPSLEAKQDALCSDELLRNFLPELGWMFDSTDCSIANRVSKTIFVPKTALSLRTISMEPAYLSYWQTPVESMLKDILKASCSHCCDLSKQEISRELALEASRCQEYSTLDISAASDSVSLALVMAAFPKEIVQRLLAVRSIWTVLPNGEKIQLKKYAPMGSRITFPLETLLFCAVCEVAVRRVGLVSFTAHRTRYWVYGDDIIVLNEYAAEVIRLLNAFGFKLSSQKCFRDGMFYEACGVFAFNGVDITTPCIPRNFRGLPQVGKPTQSDLIEVGIGLCNQFLISGMFSARQYVLERLPVGHIPFSEFQVDFLKPEKRDRKTRQAGDNPYGDKVDWSSRGLWSFHSVDNNHLRYRRVNIPEWVPPPRYAPDQSLGVLLLPGPVPRRRCSRPIWSRYEYEVLTPHIERYHHRYSDETRYAWKLRHPLVQPGDSVEIPEPPVGFGPRIRLRRNFTQF